MQQSQLQGKISRRAMLAAGAASLAYGQIRAELYRYLDPVTETPVVRLTSPSSSSLLPIAQNRFVSRTRRFLFFSSDRTGKFAPFRIDLRSGALQQFADPKNLHPRSLTLDPAERSLLFIDGRSLVDVSLSNRRSRVLHDDVDGFSMSGTGALFLLSGGRIITAGGETLATGAEAPLVAAPDGTGCYFMRSDEERCQLCWTPVAQGDNGAAKVLASGNVADPFAVANRAALYLFKNGPATQIWQVALAGDETLVAPGTQLGAFAPNRNDSVFVGASRSKAQPFIVLILRATKREMALCEHHASAHCPVNPAFSPDSRRVYFESDRDGKPAIYSVNVEQLVEPT